LEVLPTDFSGYYEFVAEYTLGPGDADFVLDLRQPIYDEFFRWWESIRLTRLSLVATIAASKDTRLHIGVYANGKWPRDVRACPVKATALSSAMGGLVFEWALPTDHSFGREIRGANAGTRYPVLYAIATSSGVLPEIELRFTVRFAAGGRAPQPVILVPSDRAATLDDDKPDPAAGRHPLPPAEQKLAQLWQSTNALLDRLESAEARAAAAEERAAAREAEVALFPAPSPSPGPSAPPRPRGKVRE
jgi:hypothetical protein